MYRASRMPPSGHIGYKDDGICRAAACGLEEIATPEAIDLLLAAPNNKTHAGRSSIASCIGCMRGEEKRRAADSVMKAAAARKTSCGWSR